jgi:sulfate adenylyltransferase subunit 2
MYAHRAKMVAQSGMKLISHTNAQGLAEGVGPFSHGSNYHTDVMKTQALKQALDANGFDVVFGGARRDEEKSRAKERVFSFRAPGHRWDPKAQRPELWNLYNTRIKPDETIRVFPISNWTELDIWQYIYDEQIPIVPLYLAAQRPVVKRGGQWIMVDDARFAFAPGEQVEQRKVRFRTLGCWPLTAAIESDADTLEAVIAETFNARSSERQGRLIDSDVPGSMEMKKQEGYF